VITRSILLVAEIKMRTFFRSPLFLLAALALASAALSSSGAQSTATQSETATGPHAASSKNLSGTWAMVSPRGVPWYNYALIGDEPPMTPWAQEKFKASKPSFGPNPHEDSNDSAYSCLPNGLPRVYAGVQTSMQMIEIPGRVLMLFGRNLRQIYTDGREHPADVHPLWMGHSIGKWDGDTFVVDTVGISDVNWLDRMGHPHSDKLHVIERFRRTDDKTMLLNLVIDDPVAYTKTWEATQRIFRLRPDARAVEAFCEDMFLNESFGIHPHLPSMK
jgi:hypothetical protein